VLPIAQAERFDVVIDFSKYKVGDRVTLVNKAGKNQTAQVMQFHVTKKEKDESKVPGTLSDLGEFDALTRDKVTVERQFEFSGGDPWQINKKPFAIDRIDADPKLGAVELWKVNTSKHHPVHLHLVQFKILERKGGGIRATDVGWKDTIDLEPHQNATVLARFTGYRGKYVFHCHNLEHEDMAMMANVEID
jgi:spore coat protein A